MSILLSFYQQNIDSESVNDQLKKKNPISQSFLVGGDDLQVIPIHD